MSKYVLTLIKKKKPKSAHPWQLWFYNVGRLARCMDDSRLAQKAWEMSVDLCSGMKAETVLAMKLLPFSALHAAGMMTNKQQRKAEEVLDLIKTSNFLHKDHFQDLLKHSDVEASLDMITKNPAMFFPFSYR